MFRVETQPRGPFPLLVGLEGPPGGGKTLSALRLAHGMQRVLSGPIVMIDTEAGRSGHYWQQIPFLMLRMEPPYRSVRFLQAINELIEHEKPAVVVVDTLSDEHEGMGGVLDYHDQEIDRICGGSGDYRRREAVSLAAWVRPKKERMMMMTGLMRITTPMIFTFRAREKTRPVQKTNKDGREVWEPTRMGYQAIAPAEICHGMTCMCLLPPHADGVPSWKTDEAGVDFLLKRPAHMQSILTEQQLSEDTGEALAHWAAGNISTSSASSTSSPLSASTSVSPPSPTSPPTSPPPATPASSSPPSPAAPSSPTPSSADHPIEVARRALAEAATTGYESLMKAWRATDRSVQQHISKEDRARWKALATEVDLRGSDG